MKVYVSVWCSAAPSRCHDPSEILLTPAHVLVGKGAENTAMAYVFADSIAAPKHGQKVTSEFAVTGVVLHTKVAINAMWSMNSQISSKLGRKSGSFIPISPLVVTPCAIT